MGHSAVEQLIQKVEAAKALVRVGAEYHHYKDPVKKYTVIDIGIQENTEEVCVLYTSEKMKNKVIWVRNLEDWLAVVENEKGQKVPRFQSVIDS